MARAVERANALSSHHKSKRLSARAGLMSCQQVAGSLR